VCDRPCFRALSLVRGVFEEYRGREKFDLSYLLVSSGLGLGPDFYVR
jgi:hypothetical protein